MPYLITTKNICQGVKNGFLFFFSCKGEGSVIQWGKQERRKGMSQTHNYQKDLDAILNTINPSQPPRLLLHGCCAPCSSYVIEYLSHYFDITLYYYNPNISSYEEFEKRFFELERLLSEIPQEHPVTLVKGEWEHTRFEEMAQGLEEVPEGGARCYKCYEMRLEKAAQVAKTGAFDYFTTTLSISPHKNAQWLNEIGQRLGLAYGVAHLPADFKKKGGYARSIELSRTYDLYRQDYCGCVYSQRKKEG